MDDFYPPPTSLEDQVMAAAWRIVVPVLAERLASAQPGEGR